MNKAIMIKKILQKSAEKLLRDNLAMKPKEKIVVVTDRKKCRIFQAICQAVEKNGGNLKQMKITNKRTSGAALPNLKKDFIEADIIIAVTDKSISHCPEVRLARKKHGVRVISMPGINEIMFIEAMLANKNIIHKTSKKIGRKLLHCRRIKITTPSGTQLNANVIKNAIFFEWGDSTRKGILNNVPFGEAGIAPINIVNGILAIDSVGKRIMPQDKVILIIKKGKIIDWNNKKAKKFVDFLKGVDGNKALRAVELSFGTNPKHKKLINNILYDEKILGSCHIAFGGLGNKRKCKIHQDVILLRPTVFFDEILVIKNGKIL